MSEALKIAQQQFLHDRLWHLRAQTAMLLEQTEMVMRANPDQQARNFLLMAGASLLAAQGKAQQSEAPTRPADEPQPSESQGSPGTGTAEEAAKSQGAEGEVVQPKVLVPQLLPVYTVPWYNVQALLWPYPAASAWPAFQAVAPPADDGTSATSLQSVPSGKGKGRRRGQKASAEVQACGPSQHQAWRAGPGDPGQVQQGSGKGKAAQARGKGGGGKGKEVKEQNRPLQDHQKPRGKREEDRRRAANAGSHEAKLLASQALKQGVAKAMGARCSFMEVCMDSLNFSVEEGEVDCGPPLRLKTVTRPEDEDDEDRAIREILQTGPPRGSWRRHIQLPLQAGPAEGPFSLCDAPPGHPHGKDTGDTDSQPPGLSEGSASTTAGDMGSPHGLWSLEVESKGPTQEGALLPPDALAAAGCAGG